MLTVNKCIAQGRGLAPALRRRATTVALAWDTRQKSRFDAVDSAGRQIGVFLPRGSVVRGGDVLLADDGSLITVAAAAQPVLRIKPCAHHGLPFDLARAAYHLGNRHVAVEVTAGHLQIEPDHVLADMLRRMHLDVESAETAFEPEAGAYQSAAGGGHPHHGGSSHGDHRHDDPHTHPPANAHDAVAAHPHAHGADGHGPEAAAPPR